MKIGSVFSRSLAIFISSSLILSSSAFAGPDGSSVWTTRGGGNKKHSLESLMDVASLPLAPLSPQSSVGALSLNGPPRSADFGRTKNSLADHLRALPANFGSVRSVVTARKENSSPVIIHIQDVHRNVEAQENIRKTVARLIKENRVGLVGLEGAFGPLPLSQMRNHPDGNLIRRAAESQFRRFRFSGPVAAGVESPGSILPPFVGVDSHGLYEQNVSAYQRALPLQNTALTKIKADAERLETQKRTVLNTALREADRRISLFHHDQASFGDHLEYLSRFAEGGISVQVFLEARKLENELNFSRVEAERKDVLFALADRLTEAETRSLAGQAVLYRTGQISPAAFYASLRFLCGEKNVDLARFPSFDSYLQYLLLTENLNSDQLMSETERLENAVYASLTINKEEKFLIHRSRQLALSEKLVRFSLTSREWEAYKAGKNKPVEAEYPSLAPFEKFYEAAEARDAAMLANLRKAMKEERVSSAVLVAGGFHTAGINKMAKDSGISSISFTPKITQVETEAGSAYLSVFAQEKTPLDALFDGQPLFLAEHPVSSGALMEYGSSIAAGSKTPELGQRFFNQLMGPLGWGLSDLKDRRGGEKEVRASRLAPDSGSEEVFIRVNEQGEVVSAETKGKSPSSVEVQSPEYTTGVKTGLFSRAIRLREELQHVAGVFLVQLWDWVHFRKASISVDWPETLANWKETILKGRPIPTRTVLNVAPTVPENGFSLTALTAAGSLGWLAPSMILLPFAVSFFTFALGLLFILPLLAALKPGEWGPSGRGDSSSQKAYDWAYASIHVIAIFTAAVFYSGYFFGPLNGFSSFSLIALAGEVFTAVRVLGVHLLEAPRKGSDFNYLARSGRLFFGRLSAAVKKPLNQIRKITLLSPEGIGSFKGPLTPSPELKVLVSRMADRLNAPEAVEKSNQNPALKAARLQMLSHLKNIGYTFRRENGWDDYPHEMPIKGPYPHQATLMVLEKGEEFFTFLNPPALDLTFQEPHPEKFSDLARQQAAFVKKVAANPLDTYKEFRARLKKEGVQASFREFSPVVETLILQLTSRKDLKPMLEENPSLAAFWDLVLTRLKNLPENRPYLDTFYAIERAVEFFDAVERVKLGERAPPLYHSDRYEYYLHAMMGDLPDHIALPTMASLGASGILKIRGVPLGFIGVHTTTTRVDGFPQTPYEMFIHDVNHSRHMYQLLKEAAQRKGIPEQLFYARSDEFVQTVIMPLITVKKGMSPEEIALRRMAKMVLFDILHEQAYAADPDVLRHEILRPPQQMIPFERLENGDEIVYYTDIRPTSLNYAFRKLAHDYYDTPEERMEFIVPEEFRTREMVVKASASILSALGMTNPPLDALMEFVSADDFGPYTFRAQLQKDIEERSGEVPALGEGVDPSLTPLLELKALYQKIILETSSASQPEAAHLPLTAKPSFNNSAKGQIRVLRIPSGPIAADDIVVSFLESLKNEVNHVVLVIGRQGDGWTRGSIEEAAVQALQAASAVSGFLSVSLAFSNSNDEGEILQSLKPLFPQGKFISISSARERPSSGLLEILIADGEQDVWNKYVHPKAGKLINRWGLYQADTSIEERRAVYREEGHFVDEWLEEGKIAQPEIWEEIRRDIAVEAAQKPLEAMRAVYSYYFPEVRNIISDLVQNFPHDVFMRSMRVGEGLDNFENAIFERFLDFQKDAVPDLETYPYRYTSSGSEETIREFISDLEAKEVRKIYVLKGEYEGYKAVATTRGIETVEVEADFDPSALEPGWFFISNPSARNGEILSDDYINRIADAGHKIFYDLSYLGATDFHRFDLSHPNIAVAAVSFSKPYGLFYYRQGFTFSREPIDGLYGNIWFKNIFSLLVADAVIKNLGPLELPEKYRARQLEIISEINQEYGLDLEPSEVILLAVRKGDEGLSESQKKLLERYRRGDGYRLTLTPYFLKKEGEGAPVFPPPDQTPKIYSAPGPGLSNEGSRKSRLIEPAWGDAAADRVDVPWAKPQFIYAQKVQGVFAKKAFPGEELDTNTNGFLITTNVAKEGDWKITTQQGDQYFLPEAKFKARYHSNPTPEGMYTPKSQVMKMLEITEPVRLFAPWGKWEFAPAGSALAYLGPDDIYLIHKDNFQGAYRRLGFEEGKRAWEGGLTPDLLKLTPVIKNFSKASSPEILSWVLAHRDALPATGPPELLDMVELVRTVEEAILPFQMVLNQDLEDARPVTVEDVLRNFTSLDAFMGPSFLSGFYFRKKRITLPVVDANRAILSGIFEEGANPRAHRALLGLVNYFIDQNNWRSLLNSHLGEANDWDIEKVEDFTIMFSSVFKLTLVSPSQNGKRREVFIKRDNDKGKLVNDVLFVDLQNRLLDGPLRPVPSYQAAQEGRSGLLVSTPYPGGTLRRGFSEVARRGDERLTLKFIRRLAAHAALGDIIGRNDRKMSNSNVEILENDIGALVDFDNLYLLDGPQNYEWIHQDILEGRSEVNILGLLDHSDPQKFRLFLDEFSAGYLEQWSRAKSHQEEIENSLDRTYAPAKAEAMKRVLRDRLSQEPRQVLHGILRTYLEGYAIRLLYKDLLGELLETEKGKNRLADLSHHLSKDSLQQDKYAFQMILNDDLVEAYPEILKGRTRWTAVANRLEAEAARILGKKRVVKLRKDVNDQKRLALDLMGSVFRHLTGTTPTAPLLNLANPSQSKELTSSLKEILAAHGVSLPSGTLTEAAEAAKQLDSLNLLPGLTGSLLKGGIPIHISISKDLTELVYSAVKDDSKVFSADGSADFSKLELEPLAAIPSSFLIFPTDYISKHFKHEELSRILLLMGQNKRYTTYDGITTAWDGTVDRDVWSTNIDTVFFHRVLTQSGILKDPSLQVVTEVGSGGGHLSALIARDVTGLRRLIPTDISLFALMATARNVINYLNGKTTWLKSYLGKGIGALDADSDLIVNNPPYIPTPPWEKQMEGDPYRGTGLIKEIMEIGVDKLNPANPNASIVMNVSNLAEADMAEYIRLFGDRVDIEKIGQPLWVPLKIGKVEKRWLEWLKTRGLREVENGPEDQPRYWHRLQVYQIRPKKEAVLKEEKLETAAAPAEGALSLVTRRNPSTGRMQILLVKNQPSADWSLAKGKSQDEEVIPESLAGPLREEADRLVPEDRPGFQMELMNVFAGGRSVSQRGKHDARGVHYHMDSDLASKARFNRSSSGEKFQWVDLRDIIWGKFEMTGRQAGLVRQLAKELTHSSEEEESRAPGPIPFIQKADFYDLDSLVINPETDVVVVVDPQKTFMPGGGLAVKGGDNIVSKILRLLRLFPKENRFASQDWHPWGHVSLASSYQADFDLGKGKKIAPLTYLTHDDVKDWTEENNGLAEHAAFSVKQLQDYLKKVGGQVLWFDHGIEGTDEAEFPDALNSDLFAFIQKKGTDPAKDSYSAFFDNGGQKEDVTGLMDEIRLRRPNVKRIFFVGLAYDFCVGWSTQDAAEKFGMETVLIQDATRPVALPPDATNGYWGSILATTRLLRKFGVRIVADTATVVKANAESSMSKLKDLFSSEREEGRSIRDGEAPEFHITSTSIEEAAEEFWRDSAGQKRWMELKAPAAPHGGNSFVAAGIEEALTAIRNRRFTEEIISALRNTGEYSEAFLHYLKNFEFKGDVQAVEEGAAVKPGDVLVRLFADPVEEALVRDLLKNRIGAGSVVATKTSRIIKASRGGYIDKETARRVLEEKGVDVYQNRPVANFGLRRIQGLMDMLAHWAAFIAGAVFTSSVRAGKLLNIPVTGTMAHLFVQFYARSQEEEADAFRVYADAYPDSSIFLIDTFDTIQGARNAAIVGREMEEKGHKLVGVRLDSGDLVALSREVRQILDNAGLHYVKIFASDNLDEESITDLLKNGAMIDAFGVGTNLVTGGKQAFMELDLAPAEGGGDLAPAMQNGEWVRPVKQPAREKDVSTALQEDLYHLTMAQAFFNDNRHNTRTTFDYFFRSPPYKDSDHVVVSGIQALLEDIKNFRFSPSDIDYLRSLKKFSEEFLESLENFKFRGDLVGQEEGTRAYPNEPIIRVTGTFLESAIIETLILKRMNFNNLETTLAEILVKKHREPLIDDTLPYAQGDAHLEVSRAAYIGGFAATTNLDAHLKFGIPLARRINEEKRIGTELAAGGPKSSLGGVYKLAVAGGDPRIKLSETELKTSLPDLKMVWQVRNPEGKPVRRVTALENEEITLNHGESKERVLKPLISEGILVYPFLPLEEIAVRKRITDLDYEKSSVRGSTLSPGLRDRQREQIKIAREKTLTAAVPSVKVAMAQIDVLIGDFAGVVAEVKERIDEAVRKGSDVVIFQEALMTGYPAQDDYINVEFLRQQAQALDEIRSYTKGKSITVVIGAIRSENKKIYNSGFVMRNGVDIKVVDKYLLARNEVYSDPRQFDPGPSPARAAQLKPGGNIFEVNGVKFGLTICEDIWHDDDDVVKELRKQGATEIINISGSHFYAGNVRLLTDDDPTFDPENDFEFFGYRYRLEGTKLAVRESLLERRARENGVNLYYVNGFGGQDEIVTDGHSYVFDRQGNKAAVGRHFGEDLIVVERTPEGGVHAIDDEGLRGRGDLEPIEQLYQALVLGLADYLKKNNLTKVAIGLSGGIDSALALAVARDAFDHLGWPSRNIIGFTMPSKFSSEGSWVDAKTQAESFEVTFENSPIKKMFTSFIYSQKEIGKKVAEKTGDTPSDKNKGLARQNLQPRLRALTLQFYANTYGNVLLLTTGNDTEMRRGYSTVGGDLEGGFAPLGNVSKLRVYALAEWRNRQAIKGKKPGFIPESSLRKPPSAELEPGQTDEENLGFSYPHMDIFDQVYSRENGDIDRVIALRDEIDPKEELSNERFALLIADSIRRYSQSEYKRRQAPPSIVVSRGAHTFVVRRAISTKPYIEYDDILERVKAFPRTEVHVKARGPHPAYPERFYVPRNLAAWAIPFDGYKPVAFTAPAVIANDRTVKKGGWADPADFESVRGEIHGRQSYEGPLQFNSNEGYPLNPRGRTGITGRGLLGKYGPNFAADPIVTRYHPDTGRLQVALIERGDTGELAIPGGMVDEGETVSAALKREFAEEAMNSAWEMRFDGKKVSEIVREEIADFPNLKWEDLSQDRDSVLALIKWIVSPEFYESLLSHLEDLDNQVQELFSNGVPIYRGYIDDPRNTDNAWMESAAVHFHAEGELAETLRLAAGSDAKKVVWEDMEGIVDGSTPLYASHKDLIETVWQNIRGSDDEKQFFVQSPEGNAGWLNRIIYPFLRKLKSFPEALARILYQGVFRPSQKDLETYEYRGLKFEVPELSGEGFEMKANPISVPKSDDPQVAAVLKSINTVWNLSEFATPRKPILIGQVQDHSSLDNFSDIRRVLDMPIKLPGTGYRVPQELAQFEPIFQQIIDYEAAINPELDKFFAYVTLDQSDVLKDKTQRNPGAHVDGFQGARVFPKVNIGHSYIVSNAVPTEFYPQGFQTSHLDERTHNFFLDFTRQADPRLLLKTNPYGIYLFDAYSLHQSGITPFDLKRSFIRVSFSVREFDRLGNTKNPLFDYKWTMVPRDVETRLTEYHPEAPVKSRGSYPDYPTRFPVPAGRSPWFYPFPNYAPVDFTHPLVFENDPRSTSGGWADSKNFNSIKNEVQNRESFEGPLSFDPEIGLPLNPRGRTGMRGRGLLGRFGPNATADPIITKVDSSGGLQILAVKRPNSNEWSLPGTFVLKGEDVSAALGRAVSQKVSHSQSADDEVTGLKWMDIFADGRVVFKGYVDDPRNTDNAWIETTAIQIYLDSEKAGKLNAVLSDHSGVQWLSVSELLRHEISLYASHNELVKWAFRELRAPVHVHSREDIPEYPRRFPLVDSQISWILPVPGYNPPQFTAPVVVENDSTKNKLGWADPVEFQEIKKEFSRRKSFEGPISLEAGTGLPLNPRGRTGLAGRGLLGKYGPNFAADPVVTRKDPVTGKLQVMGYKRDDDGKWSLPGGIVSYGEQVPDVLQRAFEQKILKINKKERPEFLELWDGLFAEGKVVHRGYIDDPRNTDNAWLETTAVHFHAGESLAKKLDLKIKGNSAGIKWLDLENVLNGQLEMHANHRDLVKLAFNDIHGENPRPLSVLSSEGNPGWLARLLTSLPPGELFWSTRAFLTQAIWFVGLFMVFATFELRKSATNPYFHAFYLNWAPSFGMSIMVIQGVLGFLYVFVFKQRIFSKQELISVHRFAPAVLSIGEIASAFDWYPRDEIGSGVFQWSDLLAVWAAAGLSYLFHRKFNPAIRKGPDYKLAVHLVELAEALAVKKTDGGVKENLIALFEEEGLSPQLKNYYAGGGFQDRSAKANLDGVIKAVDALVKNRVRDGALSERQVQAVLIELGFLGVPRDSLEGLAGGKEVVIAASVDDIAWLTQVLEKAPGLNLTLVIHQSEMDDFESQFKNGRDNITLWPQDLGLLFEKTPGEAHFGGSILNLALFEAGIVENLERLEKDPSARQARLENLALAFKPGVVFNADGLAADSLVDKLEKILLDSLFRGASFRVNLTDFVALARKLAIQA